MNADVTKCGGIWRAFQLLETSVNLQQHRPWLGAFIKFSPLFQYFDGYFSILFFILLQVWHPTSAEGGISKKKILLTYQV